MLMMPHAEFALEQMLGALLIALPDIHPRLLTQLEGVASRRPRSDTIRCSGILCP